MENIRPVRQLNLDGSLVKDYDSIKQAVKQFGGTKKAYSRIAYALAGRKNIKVKTYSAYGYLWAYKE